MSRLMTKRAEQHANFLAAHSVSRPLGMSRPYESISAALQAKITEQSFSALFHIGRPHESTL